MASLMENLISVLNEESKEYESLLELSLRKTPVIVSEDLEKLAKITDEEQLLISRINHLDKKRDEVIADIANVLNKDVKTLNIKNLIKMLSGRPSEQKALSAAYDSLMAIVKHVARVNAQNQELIQNALDMVRFNMTILQSAKAAPENANYNRNAYNTGATLGTSYTSFDAKQ